MDAPSTSVSLFGTRHLMVTMETDVDNQFNEFHLRVMSENGEDETKV